MLKKSGYFVILTIGIALGIAIEKIQSYQKTQVIPDSSELLEKVLVHTNIQISEANYACEGKPVRTVGAVVASIIELNSQHSKNLLSYGCYKETCTISYTECRPWQSSECSSRFLKFLLSDDGKINTHTFSCFDMP